MKKDLITPLSINMPKQESYESFMDEFTIDNMGVDSLSTTKDSKLELVEADLLINLKKKVLEKYGCANISNDWKTAVEQSIELQRAYLKGHNDGYQKAVEEAREFYQGKEKENGKEEN